MKFIGLKKDISMFFILAYKMFAEKNKVTNNKVVMLIIINININIFFSTFLSLEFFCLCITFLNAK
ncbi:hypothetical protein NPL4_02545 [Metamycoplasma hyosynoviae]|nr:hypothetical protein NPL4_02545 [Metamycoplasma hyosynoviae]